MRKLLSVFLASFIMTAAFAQPKKIVADKIIGIVGDRIILYSDIQNTIADIQRQGGTVPENAECSVIEQAMVSKVLMLQATKDSLPVTDEEIEAELDQRVRYFIRQYGTQEEVERLAGKTIYQIKDEARESVRERKLAEAMQRKIVENVKITPNEVKAYFDRIPKDSLPFFESEVEVGQIVAWPKSSKELEKYTYDELANYKKQIENKGMTFEQGMKLYSQDPGGSKYQINRNEKTWDPVFMAAAFRLKEGEISPIIKTQFGYHILKMVQRSGDDAIVEHILRIPPITEDEINIAINRLDSVRSKLIAGTLEINAAAKYSDDPAAKYSGIWIMSGDGDTYNRIDELDKDIVAQLSKMKVGTFSQPTVYTDEQQKKIVRIIYYKSRSEPHKMNLRDDYNKISSAALEEKKYKALEKWLDGHIPTYYIMLDEEASKCTQLEKWTSASKTASNK